MHINWPVLLAKLGNPVFWLEMYIHFLAICSALTRFVFNPFLEWAQDPQNVSPEKFKKIHSYLDLIARYGALNGRADLPALRPSQAADVKPAGD